MIFILYIKKYIIFLIIYITEVLDMRKSSYFLRNTDFYMLHFVDYVKIVYDPKKDSKDVKL